MSIRRASLALLMMCAQFSYAACSRPIVVPASPLGKMVVVNESTGEVSGIYPDLLRERGKRIGCEFVFPVVPRARAEAMAQTGESDLLVAAVKVPDRDMWGVFVPMMGTEWMLITARTDMAPKSVDELLQKSGIKFNAVKSFNYGPAYLAMLAHLDRQGKLEYVKDPETIVRKMAAGRVDYAFMPSTTFAAALDKSGLRESLGAKIRYSRLSGLPPSTTGVYVSKMMPEGDVGQIVSMFVQIRKDGEMLTRLRMYFTREEMSSLFPLPNK